MSHEHDFNLRDYILTRKHRPIQTVSVPEWDAEVSIRPLSVRQRAALGDLDEAELQVEALILGCVDPFGEPLFQEDDRETILDSFEGSVVNRLAMAILKGNTPSIEALEKKSDPIPSTDSPSD